MVGLLDTGAAEHVRCRPTSPRPRPAPACSEAKQVLTLEEVERYGIDSFGDANYISIYGMTPSQWYGRGIRLLGRTAVECTRDVLVNRIGRDIAQVVATLPTATPFTVIDPFAGSCNTLYWILRNVPNATGIGFELDPQVYELSKQNIAGLDQTIALSHGPSETLLSDHPIPPEHALIVFVAPPWGTALDEKEGLDLRRTTPPITEIIADLVRRYPGHKMLFATQVYEKVNVASLAELDQMLDWSDLRVYDLNVEGRNHGSVVGTKGWKP